MGGIIRAVESLNVELFQQSCDESIQLVYSTDGFTETVSFLGCRILNSDSDSWDEDGDFNSVEEFLSQRVVDLIDVIKNISIVVEK